MKCYKIEAKLLGVKTDIKRTFVIRVSATYYKLAYCMLALFNTDARHMFGFKVGNFLVMSREDEEEFDLMPGERVEYLDRRIDRLIGKGLSFVFEYDYGAGWEFELNVIEEFEGDGKAKLLDGEGYGIIEDIAPFELDSKLKKLHYVLDFEQAQKNLDLYPKILKKLYETDEEITEKEDEILSKKAFKIAK